MIDFLYELSNLIVDEITKQYTYKMIETLLPKANFSSLIDGKILQMMEL